MTTSFAQPDHSHKVAAFLRPLRHFFASFAVKGFDLAAIIKGL